MRPASGKEAKPPRMMPTKVPKPDDLFLVFSLVVGKSNGGCVIVSEFDQAVPTSKVVSSVELF